MMSKGLRVYGGTRNINADFPGTRNAAILPYHTSSYIYACGKMGKMWDYKSGIHLEAVHLNVC